MKAGADNISKTRAAEVGALLEEVAESLRFYAAGGCSGGDCSPENLACLNQWNSPACLAGDSLAGIRRDVAGCSQCRPGHASAGPVPGVGSAPARLMFVGGWPAADIKRGDSLLTGETGRLLTAMINAMNLSFEEVFVTCLVKCRPPGESAPEAAQPEAAQPEGAQPEGAQIDRCRWFLEREMTLVAPEMICTLGETATRWMLDSRDSLTSLRGRFHERNGMTVMPTWHPADILKKKERKRPVWEDLKMVMAALKKSPV